MGGTQNPRPRLAAMNPWLGVFLCAAGLFSIGCAACGDGTPGAGVDPSFADEFEILSEVALDEGAGAISRSAQVRAGGEGEILVVDRAERRIRSYSTEGELRWSITHPTLQEPLVSIRLDATTLLVAGAHGQVALLDAADSTRGPRPGPPIRLPGGVGMMDDVDVVSDSLVAYSARPVLTSRAHIAALHVVEPRSGRLLRSLFEPEMSAAVDSLAPFIGWVRSSVRGDTMASVFAPLDTIFLHSIDGEALERIPLPTTTFRVLDRPRRPGERMGEWTAGVSFTSDVFWLATGDFVVQFIESDRGEPRQHLLGVSRSGELLFQIDDSPRLLAVLPSGDFLFSPRGANAPNRLLVARMR